MKLLQIERNMANKLKIKNLPSGSTSEIDTSIEKMKSSLQKDSSSN